MSLGNEPEKPKRADCEAEETTLFKQKPEVVVESEDERARMNEQGKYLKFSLQINLNIS